MSQKKAGSKGRAVAVRQSPQQKAAATRAANKARAEALEKANAQRLAQIVNLHIAGFSLADIGASIGASAEEVERLLTSDTARYVKTQPALRVYVRNFISAKYTKLLEAVYDEATDKNHPQKLENSAQALRILKEMERLHGAAAPTQTEVTVDAAPEAVERLVQALSSQQGVGYDDSIFDVVEAEIVEQDVHDAVQQSEQVLYDAGEAVGESVDGEDETL